MLTHHDLLFGLVLPALVGAVLFVLARPSNDRLPAGARFGAIDARGRDASPFALVLGYLVAENALLGRPAIPPAEAAHTLYFALCGLAVLSLGYELLAGGVWRFYVPISIATVMAPTIWLIVRPLAGHTWSGTETAAWVGGSITAAAALTVALDWLYADLGDLAASTSVVLVFGLTAAVLLISGTKTYGQLAAATAVTLAPGAPLAAIGLRRPFSRSIAPGFVLLLGGLLLAGHLYASLTPLNALLLLVAPLGIGLGKLPAVGRWPVWRRALLELVAVALPAGVAAGLAAGKFLEDTAGGY